MGVYRQEFYQFIEQISKHVWAIDDYEYAVALAGLSYMSDSDCFYVGASSSGELIYAGVAPKQYGKFEMALYTDGYCLTPNENLGMTYDDFGLTSDADLGGDGDEDGGGDDNYSNSAQEWWQDTQEYTFTLLNEVYENFTYCTSCLDYPTYQDGYLIGDSGTDEDDMINQCWKFYSHDSYTCESDCIALGHAQGTILSVTFGDKSYGKLPSGYSSTTTSAGAAASTSVEKESKFSRLLANAFVTISFIVFVATFLAFAVARRSRYRESRSSKSRRLLDEDDRASRSRKRSHSKKGEEATGDGIFRTTNSSSGRKARSKSSSRRDSKDKSSSGRTGSASRSRSHGRDKPRDADYEAPSPRQRSRSAAKRSASKSRRDDF
jgi:hypothetical protein